MSQLSQGDALETISTWTIRDVETLLRKNGLEEECCKTIAKRNIGGDELLHLTEGKLSLWKSDLARPQIWSLWAFVEELRKNPVKYVEEKRRQTENVIEDSESDTDSWATDFGDGVEESVDDNVEAKAVEIRAKAVPKCSEIRNSLKVFQENDKAAKQQQESKATNVSNKLNNNKIENDNAYANYEMSAETETTYANWEATAEVEVPKLQKNESKLHRNEFKMSLAEQLKEQLMLMDAQKVSNEPTPKVISTNRENSKKRSPQTSFLHTKTSHKRNGTNEVQTKMFLPCSVDPPHTTPSFQVDDSVNKNLPKPPDLIKNFDLVVNIPTQTEDSDYEAFDLTIIEEHRKRESIMRADSKHCLASVHRSSVESIYHSPSITSHEEECEIYEHIPETPEDSETDSFSTARTTSKEIPPPLPEKPSNMRFDHKTGVQKKDEGLGHFTETDYKPVSFQYYGTRSDLQQSIKNSLERSPDKKFDTSPHSGSNTSLSPERATRPLPPPPERQSLMDKPWFHNVSREQAMILIREQSTYGNNPQDGYFLIRPSTTNPTNPFTLVLWYKDRVYNVPVRRRTDNRYALGSPKINEHYFASVEDIVPFYTKQELYLHSGGIQMGNTKLTDSPTK